MEGRCQWWRASKVYSSSLHTTPCNLLTHQVTLNGKDGNQVSTLPYVTLRVPVMVCASEGRHAVQHVSCIYGV